VSIPVLYPGSHSGHDPEIEFVDGVLRDFVECPQRVDLIRDRLLQARLVTECKPVGSISIEEVLETHDAEMVACLEAASGRMAEETGYSYASVFAIRPEMTRVATNPVHPYGHYCFDSDTPIGKATWQAALSSAGTAAAGAALIVEDGARCVYALCRPPGHHAGSDYYGGYCYLNNAGIAAKRLLALGKAAIVDIDYHHGNGTQEIFWNEAQVMFGSLHGDPDCTFPFYSGYADETGGPGAPGTNVNIPLPAGTDGKAYLAVLDRLLEQVSVFDPTTLVVSVGFDTYAGDPLSTFELEVGDYAHIGARLAQLDRPTLLVQEGGYCLKALGALAENLLSGFLTG
jgi:acetoin utilization deacetylase AcuC-like enzyme